MRQFSNTALLISATVFLLLSPVTYAIAYRGSSYADLNSRSRESIRKLADILDQEIVQRRMESKLSGYYDTNNRYYPSSRIPSYAVLPIPAKRLQRIGGNIVMG